MLIKYLGHSCFWIEFGEKRLLIDPFIAGNPMASNINQNDLEVDYMLITHGHGDHIGDAIDIGQRTKAIAIANFEVQNWLVAQGIRAYAMNLGGKFKFDFGTVKMVSAIHSSVLPDGSNGGNPGGFVVWNESQSFYIAGDTALTYDMKLIPLTCPPLTFAILPLGDVFTMGYEDAIIASQWINCDLIIGCHFDTFEPIRIDHKKAQEAFAQAGKKLILPEIGQVINL
ncbi:MAG: metal-dependent hydrolase [Saprospiraceae bacterium]|nr:metal-dependent hydrolase [Candidatus Defluviibacterium haderslevense]MBK8244530.1 metal-dependent hydrolase [Candidatus Defluviibacterium haderslevense]